MVDRVDIKLGWSCNNRCRFCVQGDKRSRFVDRSTDEVTALLEEAREVADEVVFTGGEVTLRPDLPELVARARFLGFRLIQIQTNGRRLADEGLCDALLEAGATEFSPALHAPIAAAHDYLTRVQGSFRQTLRGVLNLKHRGARVITNTVITRSSYRLLGDLGHLLTRLQVDQYQFAFPHPLGSAGESILSTVPRMSSLREHLLAGVAPGLRAGIGVRTEAIPLCFLPEGYESLASERLMPRTRVFDAESVIDDYSRYRISEGKAKGPPCEVCRRCAECEGPWREYPEHFGWAEFVPVSS